MKPTGPVSDHEVVRLIGQHLTNIGLKTSAAVLMAEAGCKLDQPTAATFKTKVLGGDWAAAVKSEFRISCDVDACDKSGANVTFN